MTALRRLVAEARLVIPDELAELPQVAAGAALVTVVLAAAWVMLP